MADDNAVDPVGHGSTVWMQELDEANPLRHAMHIDVSVSREQVAARLEAAVAAGGRIVDESHAPLTGRYRIGQATGFVSALGPTALPWLIDCGLGIMTVA